MVPPCPSDQLTFWQPFMRSRKVGNYHRFFLPTLSCVSAELLPHISGTGVLLIKLMVFPYGLSVLCPGSKVQIFVLRIFQACMTCLLWFHTGQTSFSKTHISANFLALILNHRSFFSLTFIDPLSFCLIYHSVVLIRTSCSENFMILIFQRNFFSLKKQLYQQNKTFVDFQDFYICQGIKSFFFFQRELDSVCWVLPSLEYISVSVKVSFEW